MLTLIVPGEEIFNEADSTFHTTEATVLFMEHSLVSLSKWESKTKKPFLGPQEKTSEEIVYYIKCMILNSDFPEDVFDRFNQGCLTAINEYIEGSQSATTFHELHETKGKTEIITSELIYYWLVAFNIPFECQHWHLSRLFALIRVCNVKNAKPKKLPKSEIARRNRELNAQRRAELGTSG